MRLGFPSRYGVAAALLLALVTVSAALPAVAQGEGYLWTRTITMKVPAVARTETGYIGVMSKLVVTVAAPGHGVVYVSADPLTELDMQAAARMAALVAATLAGFDYYSFDYFIHVESNTSIVGGPSASGAMAVAIMAALRGTSVRSDFSMTGMVDPDATLGPVGGIPEKLLAAADSGVKVFVIPAGQEKALDLNTGMKVDVVRLGAEKGVKVVVAKTIVDAYVVATGDHSILKEIPPAAKTIYPAWLRASLSNTAKKFMKLAEGNITCLRRVASSLPEAARTPFTQVIDAAEKYITEGERFLRDGLYYSAASRFFAAAISATSGCLLAKALLSPNPVRFLADNVSRYIDAANNTLNLVEPALRGMLYRSKNLTDVAIQLSVATLIRINDGRVYASKAKTLLSEAERGTVRINTDILSEIVDDAVYAYYRSLTAKQWYRLLREHHSGREVTPQRLRTAAYMLTYFADSTNSYSLALGVPATNAAEAIHRAKMMLEKAQSTLDYIEALVYAIRGYTLTTTHLRAAFLAGNESIEAAREGLTLLLGLAESKGLTPLLPSLYREYGDTLSGTAALSLYIQGASYALLLNTLVSGKKPAIQAAVKTVTAPPKTYTVTTKIVKTITITVTKPGYNVTVTKVPITITEAKTVHETTVTMKTTVTKEKTVSTTVTKVVRVGGTASWVALFLTAIVALLAGVAAGRMGSHQ